MNDLIYKQTALDAIDSWRREYPLDLREPIDDCWNAVKELPTVQPEIIRCKDCKYMIDTGDELMCDNAKGWVVATASDFGCVLAERRSE